MFAEDYARRDAIFAALDLDALDLVFPDAVANPDNAPTLGHARCLSDGTMATITGYNDGFVLEKIKWAYCAFVMKATATFRTWQEAWLAFAESLASRAASAGDAAESQAEPALAGLDELVRRHSVFPDFASVLNAEGGYRPSCYAVGHKGREAREKKILADAYDRAQRERGDPRRAFRG